MQTLVIRWLYSPREADHRFVVTTRPCRAPLTQFSFPLPPIRPSTPTLHLHRLEIYSSLSLLPLFPPAVEQSKPAWCSASSSPFSTVLLVRSHGQFSVAVL